MDFKKKFLAYFVLTILSVSIYFLFVFLDEKYSKSVPKFFFYIISVSYIIFIYFKKPYRVVYSILFASIFILFQLLVYFFPNFHDLLIVK